MFPYNSYWRKNLSYIVTKDSPCFILSRYMRGPIPKKSHIHGSIVTKVYSIELRHHEKLIDFKCEHCGKEFPSFIEITRHVRTIRHLHELIYSYMRTQHTSSRWYEIGKGWKGIFSREKTFYIFHIKGNVSIKNWKSYNCDITILLLHLAKVTYKCLSSKYHANCIV